MLGYILARGIYQNQARGRSFDISECTGYNQFMSRVTSVSGSRSQGLLVEAFFQAFFRLYWQRSRLNCSAINVFHCSGCFSVFFIATSNVVARYAQHTDGLVVALCFELYTHVMGYEVLF